MTNRPARAELVIPDNEQWLHGINAASSLQAAMSWSVRNKPQITDLNKFAGCVKGTFYSKLPAASTVLHWPTQPARKQKRVGLPKASTGK
jgi:hypothetical protein